MSLRNNNPFELGTLLVAKRLMPSMADWRITSMEDIRSKPDIVIPADDVMLVLDKQRNEADLEYTAVLCSLGVRWVVSFWIVDRCEELK